MTVSRASRRASLAALAFVAAISLPSLALAEPSAADKETARSLMSKGREQTDNSDLKGALESFQAADAIMHVPSTGFAVAKAQAQLGLLVEARETALQVSRLPPVPNEPVPFVEARAKAKALSDELETRIPAVQVALKNVPAGATPTVTVDGAALPAAALTLPRKVNPGHHIIVARATSVEGKAELDLKERETRIVDVELAPATASASEGAAPRPIETPREGSKVPVLAYAGFGVGLAGVVVGTVTGLVSMSKTSSLKDQCPDGKCPPSVYDSSSFQSDLSSAKTMGTVSTISFIVGGVGIGVGVVALLLPSDAPARASTAGKLGATKMERQGPRISPFVGVGSAGLVGSF